MSLRTHGIRRGPPFWPRHTICTSVCKRWCCHICRRLIVGEILVLHLIIAFVLLRVVERIPVVLPIAPIREYGNPDLTGGLS